MCYIIKKMCEQTEESFSRFNIFLSAYMTIWTMQSRVAIEADLLFSLRGM